MDGLTQSDQAHIARAIEAKQAAQFLTLYQRTVQTCFSDCVSGFTSEALSRAERECLQRCTAKMMRVTSRIGEAMVEKQQQPAGSASSPAPT